MPPQEGPGLPNVPSPVDSLQPETPIDPLPSFPKENNQVPNDSIYISDPPGNEEYSDPYKAVAIRFTVIDEKTLKPIPGVELSVPITDSKKDYQGITDEFGMVEITFSATDVNYTAQDSKKPKVYSRKSGYKNEGGFSFSIEYGKPHTLYLTPE